MFSLGFHSDGDPALVLELVQRGVERSVAHLQDVTGYLLEALPDGPAVERLEGEDFENQQVERALDEIGWPAHGASLGYRELHIHPFLSVSKGARCSLLVVRGPAAP